MRIEGRDGVMDGVNRQLANAAFLGKTGREWI